MNMATSKSLYKIALIIMLGTSVLFSGVASASTTTQNVAPYESQTEQYALVSASAKLTSLTKWKVEVDFGQQLKLGIKNKDLLRDANDKVISFNSPIDAVNYMNSKGWRLVSARSGSDYFSAVMKRIVESEE
ncbi:hypothetical protein [Vibrio rotiferianus]|uniref:hypothetical protein n=1 Tax=Vibrio rotiferianus TaxID=190895 RepID=UPI00406A544D